MGSGEWGGWGVGKGPGAVWCRYLGRGLGGREETEGFTNKGASDCSRHILGRWKDKTQKIVWCHLATATGTRFACVLSHCWVINRHIASCGYCIYYVLICIFYILRIECMLCINLYILLLNYVCASIRIMTRSLARIRMYGIVVMQKGLMFCRIMSMLN